MDNKEIIEAIAVLNDTLKTINPEGFPVIEGYGAPSDTYIAVCKKIKSLTSMIWEVKV